MNIDNNPHDDIDVATFANLQRSTSINPHRLLLIAVLEQAWIDLRAARAQKQEDTEVLAWFRSNEADWPFSFMAICQVLDIAPDRLRRQLKC